MSSNKIFKGKSLRELQTPEEKLRRVSFDSRVCDDLSEVILQFLPIKDKFRLECVSKQFQRTVYKRHYTLIVRYGMIKNLTAFKSILKKLPIIKSLIFYWIKPLNNSTIDLVIKYCSH